MFNGLIREIATVKSYSNHELRIVSKYRPSIGDSIAVNGACLSVVKLFLDGFSVELSSESEKHLALENYKNRVHIEPAMRLGDRVDGHLIQGHIDSIGTIFDIKHLKSGVDFFIKLNSNIMHLVCKKGSIAVDGVSLTVNEVLNDGIRLSIIPLTIKDTLFGEFGIGRRVNIETDMFARYIQRQIDIEKLNKENEKEEQWRQIELALRMY